jgi:FKBP-type peptidyl-prolyl cis-trans isomerase FklB
MRRWAMAIGILFLTVSLCGAEEPAATAPAQESAVKAPAEESAFKTLKEKVSYAIGMAFGRDTKTQGIELDPDIFIRGFKDTVSGAKPAMTDEEAQMAMTAFQSEMMVKKQEEMKKAGEENKKLGEAFLTENKGKEGVKTTASGLQYKIVKEGVGKKPTAQDTVSVNYKGSLVDGKEFDSSYKRNQPAVFPVSGVIPGWTEALQLMKTGSKYEVVIPSALAYGEAGAGGVIPPNATLVFEVELISINPPEAKTSPKAGTAAGGKTSGQTGKAAKSK